MKKYFVCFIIFVNISSSIFAQFYTKLPDFRFDVDFGSESLGTLHYNGYRVNEEDFWMEIITGAYFQHQIDPPETLIPRSYSEMENNTALDEYVKATMQRNNITVCTTLYANDFGGFFYIINYSFDNYKTFGFISMASTGYISTSSPVTPQSAPAIVPKYTVITGRSFSLSITQDELRKRINLQEYNEIISWLRWGSNSVVESKGIASENLISVLVNNFKSERTTAENNIKNIENTIRYQWLTDSNNRITDWIVYSLDK